MADFLTAFWQSLTMMAPYLLFGFLVAGVLAIFISPQSVERHLGGRGFLAVLKATLFGIPLPLCSCGVLPVTAALRRHKAGKGAATAFLLSTPQTGFDSIFVTFGMLGTLFAVVRPLGALVSGLLGGMAINLFDTEENARDSAAPPCTEDCCGTSERPGGWLLTVLRHGFVTLPRDIARPMLTGLIAAGLIAWLIPEGYLYDLLGAGLRPKLIMMLIGIPSYVCATASVPVAAALIAKGVSPGAALVFLMTGPATHITALTTVWKILGRRSTLIYLGVIATVSILAGTLLDAIYIARATLPAPEMAHLIPAPINAGAAIILLAILLKAAWPQRPRAGTRGAERTAAKLILRVRGMSCRHCADLIQGTLLQQPGVEAALVDWTSGRAEVSGKDLDPDLLRSRIKELGYDAEPAPPV